MKFKINGPAKYLIASILFGTFSIPMFVHAIYLQFTDKSPLFAFSAGFIGFTLMMLWFWHEYKKTGKDPLGKTRFFFIGYMFSWLGIGFTQTLLHVEKSAIGGAFVAPIVSIIIGIPLLFLGIRILVNPNKKDKLARKIINFAIGFAVFAGLMPVVLIIVGAYYNGNYIIASILLAVLSFCVWLFWFLFKKKKKKEKIIDSFLEEKEKNKELKLSDYIKNKNK